MKSQRIISFRIAPERVSELDSIAKVLDRNRSHLLNEAVESYLSQQRLFVAMVKEGLRASKNGETMDDEEVGVLIESWARERPANKKKNARARS